MTDKAFLRIVVSFLVLHLVAAVGLLIMEATVKALETKVAQLEANLGKKNETASSSHGATSSSIVLVDHSLHTENSESLLRHQVPWSTFSCRRPSLVSKPS